MALIKMLYLADRQSLLDSGYPITGDEMYSMRHGPVLSRILDFITWGDGQEAAGSQKWLSHIQVDPDDAHGVRLLKDPGRDHLSDEELAILDGIFDRFHKMNQWGLREFTHTLPEWTPTTSSCRIDPARILRREGWSPEDIEIAVHAAEQRWMMRHSRPRNVAESV
jgi:uncharacterized phage-associated protein